MGANWLITAFRVIISFLDWVVYGLISIVYDLFIDISSAGIFSQDTIQTFASRIYVFLGLIMVFKVSISLVNYIMNPDLFTDKSKGGGALLKGFMIALIGIVLVPYVFEMAYNLQAIILKNNVIGNLIVGMKADTNVSGSNNYTSKGGGKNMAYTTLSGFYHLNVDDLGLNDECIENPTAGGCLDLVTDDKVKDKITSSYNNKTPQGLLSIPVTSATVQVNGEKTYVMSYLVIISTLAGALIVYILALFCVDIAIRSVKLSFLQLIAPIPLIAKVDPKGDGVFNKWIKMCVSTYLDLFIRLAAIYLALFIINAITSDGVQNMAGGSAYTGFSGLLVKIMIIIGALMFAKDLPKFIKDLTGLDIGGSGFTAKGMKALGGKVDAAGKAGLGLAGRTAKNIGGIAVGGLGLAAGAAGKAISNKYAGSDLQKAVNGVGEWYGNTGFKKRLDSTGNAIGDTAFGKLAGGNLSKIRADAGATFGGMTSKKDDRKLNQYKKITDAVGKMEERAKEKITSGAAGALSAEYIRRTEEINAYRNAGNASAAAREQSALNDWMNSNDPDGAVSQFIDGSNSGKFKVMTGVDEEGKTVYTEVDADYKEDKTLSSMYKDYVAATSAAGQTTHSDASRMHSQMGELKGASSDINRKKIAAQEAQAKK